MSNLIEVNESDKPAKSMDLWSMSSIIGRECASVSLAFLRCKQVNGEAPFTCLEQARMAHQCGNNMLVLNIMGIKYIYTYTTETGPSVRRF